ncbi:MAG TPA: Uma2 family endonuclease [Chloroflexota bacterium]|nr:Uma2 family endonuclease [Chloroflexota bacterium]
MVAERQPPAMTVEEYLALEETSPVKHEYVRSRVFAMADVTLAHDTIANNIRAAIYNHLGDGPWAVRGPALRLRVREDIYYYPDAMVTCDDSLVDSAVEISAPRLIVEVLSDSTEAADRGHKFTDYQRLTTMEEYLLVDSRRRSAERFQRAAEGRWTYQRYSADDAITLESVGLTCAVAAFYRHTHVEGVS